MQIELDILNRLKEIEPLVKMHQKGEVFLVGGLVRDHFLNKESKDIDLLVCGIPVDKIKTMLNPFGKVDEVGESFGVIKFTPKNWEFDEPIDIAIPRTEKKIGDGHKGFEVRASSNIPLEVDLMRRDFTINAMVISLDGTLIDPFGGLNDLKNKSIKMVNPDAFKDDPLRMMRAIQFAARFGFEINMSTWEAILDNSKSIQEISGERITIELDKIFNKGDKKCGINLFMESTLHFRLFGKLPSKSIVHISSISTRADFFLSMNIDSGEFTTILKGDVKTAKLMDAITFLESKVAKLMNTCSTYDLDCEARLVIAEAHKISSDILDSSKGINLMGTFMKPFRDGELPITIKGLDINGNDLMELGFKGPDIGIQLNSIFESVLRLEIDNKKEQIIEKLKTVKHG
jgi:tRNA nucleotidyltransferase (CCA-adding enzyme)